MGYVLGITCYGSHDAAAALIESGNVIAAVEEERFSRKKFDRSFPKNSIDYCLKYAGIEANDLDAIAFFWDPRLYLAERLKYFFRYLPNTVNLIRYGSDQGRLLGIERELRKRYNYKGKFYFVEHHLAHAASAFLLSPFEKASIISVDGIGEFDTTWCGTGEGSIIRPIYKLSAPYSLGQVYSSVTQYLGFSRLSDEYKVMGLAAYGKPKFIDHFRDIIPLDSKLYKVDIRYFSYFWGGKKRYSGRFERVFGPPRKPDEEISQRHKDIAASLQMRLEEVICHIIKKAVEYTGINDVCLAGGVALNSVANGLLTENKIAENVFIPPCASDSGASLGAALFVHYRTPGCDRRICLRTAFLGPSYGIKDIEAALNKKKIKYRKTDNVYAEAAGFLNEGKVIGWFRGRMEFGQRALGARSIIADPRFPEMKNIVNKKIKYREPFRPFAASIMKEYQSDFFYHSRQTPFMTEVFRVKEGKAAEVPAIVHVDGTCRIQTVIKNDNPCLWQLIDEFRKLTNIPLVLNTSFNRKNEPIVNTPEEALECFYDTGLDALFMEDFIVEKTGGAS